MNEGLKLEKKFCEMCEKVDFECLNGCRSVTVKEKERGRQRDRDIEREKKIVEL